MARPGRRASSRAAAPSRADSGEPTSSRPGLSRASTNFVSISAQNVDGRDKPGHDDVLALLPAVYAARTPARKVPTSPESCSACLERFEAAASTMPAAL